MRPAYVVAQPVPVIRLKVELYWSPPMNVLVVEPVLPHVLMMQDTNTQTDMLTNVLFAHID